MPGSADSVARLIALDWGTSNLRASVLGVRGAVLDTRWAPVGVMAVPERRFEEALQALCGDWLREPRRPLVASGMIGSRQGWVEAPYLDCPATLRDAASRLTAVPLRSGARLYVVPGLRCTGDDGQADVMRGEETQLWGAGLPDDGCCVLPGTHSKWAWMGPGGAVRHFRTYMTGEVYGLLTQHGILGRLMRFDGPPQPEAFDQGLRLGLSQHAHLLHTLFAARTAGLVERIAPEGLPEFLSGILLGAEVGSACAGGAPPAVALLGEPALCERYARALQIAAVACSMAAADASTRGQWRVAVAAGLLEGS